MKTKVFVVASALLGILSAGTLLVLFSPTDAPAIFDMISDTHDIGLGGTAAVLLSLILTSISGFGVVVAAAYGRLQSYALTGLLVAEMVLGIYSWFWLTIVSVPHAITGLVLARKWNERSH